VKNNSIDKYMGKKIFTNYLFAISQYPG